MSNNNDKVLPTSINLHQKSRILDLDFSDGERFKLPCEYLRVFSPAAEVKVAQQPVHGKAEVTINNIEQQGSYALRLFFDDGHDTGVYSWDTLYRLGKDFEKNWAAYLQKLAEHGLERGLPALPSERTIRILYFMHLVTIAGEESESVALPVTVVTVGDLLAWLRERGRQWTGSFANTQVQVTVNKQFAELSTPIVQDDEVAIVPRGET